MSWYPYVEPIPVALTWSGESLAAILLVSALFVAGVLALFALRAALLRRPVSGPGRLPQVGARWVEVHAGRRPAARSALGTP